MFFFNTDLFPLKKKNILSPVRSLFLLKFLARDEIKDISATKIREDLRKKGKL